MSMLQTMITPGMERWLARELAPAVANAAARLEIGARDGGALVRARPWAALGVLGVLGVGLGLIAAPARRRSRAPRRRLARGP